MVYSGNYKDLDKTQVKLFPNFTRHHLITHTNTIDSFTNVIILGADVKNGKEVKFKLALNLSSFKAGTSCTPEFVKVMSIYLRLFSHMKNY